MMAEAERAPSSICHHPLQIGQPWRARLAPAEKTKIKKTEKIKKAAVYPLFGGGRSRPNFNGKKIALGV